MKAKKKAETISGRDVVPGDILLHSWSYFDDAFDMSNLIVVLAIDRVKEFFHWKYLERNDAFVDDGLSYSGDFGLDMRVVCKMPRR